MADEICLRVGNSEKDSEEMGIALPKSFAACLQNLNLATGFVLEDIFQNAIGHVRSNGLPVFRAALR